MSEALLLLARDDGAGTSSSQATPWKTSEQEAAEASSLWEECRIREARDVSVIGGSSRSGVRNEGTGVRLVEGLKGRLLGFTQMNKTSKQTKMSRNECVLKQSNLWSVSTDILWLISKL